MEWEVKYKSIIEENVPIFFQTLLKSKQRKTLKKNLSRKEYPQTNI